MSGLKQAILTGVIFLIVSCELLAIESRIIGKVVDAATSEPLVAANITIEGTSIGTASNRTGRFIIKKLPPGKYLLKVTFMGYEPLTKDIMLTAGESSRLTLRLNPMVLEGERITIMAKAEPNRAIERETPVAFTTVDLIELKNKYTTGDLPELIQDVPGVWTSTAGIGESEITLRGFSSDKVRFMLNDIPMNEPEDQQVYWSNWAGLSNTAYAIQVQRGPGFSLYGSGAFGGSIHIETMGVGIEPGTTLRFSIGSFQRKGISSGINAGKIADPLSGRYVENIENAVNYTYSARFNSGSQLGGKLNISAYCDYKIGDSYILGTDYDGFTLGLEAESHLQKHWLRFSFMMSPQAHNQAFAMQDIDLLDSLGREYNRMYHDWQENYYAKPFWQLKHEWQISEIQRLSNNVFFTVGNGADQTLLNGLFDVENGALIYQKSDAMAFGEHAFYLWKNFGIQTTDFYPPSEAIGSDTSALFQNLTILSKVNFFADQHEYSWQDRRRRDHRQFGFSTIYQLNPGALVHITLGAEGRIWRGHRVRECWELYYYPMRIQGRDVTAIQGDKISEKQIQSIYDYDTDVNNFSLFSRFAVKPLSVLTLLLGGQYYYSGQKVIENPIRFFDFGAMKFFNQSYRTSADQIDENGNLKFAEEDYQRSYHFITPWAGINWNITRHFNAFANYALAKKEPAILDWYDFDVGPRTGTTPDAADDAWFQEKLNPEMAYSGEAGFGVQLGAVQASVNYYYTIYKDKIESVVDLNERRLTMNAGEAIFQGIEAELKGGIGNFDFSGSASIARNRWQKLNVWKIFGARAEDIVGKVVPFSPERILSTSAGYYFEPYPTHRYRIGVSINAWDEYYGTYTNSYTRADGAIYRSRLPYFFDLSTHLSFTKRTKKADITFRIDANNILNRENFMRALYTIDYNRNDELAGKYHWYVLQAPLLNIFFTTEVTLY